MNAILFKGLGQMKRQMDKGLLGLGFANDELIIIEVFLSQLKCSWLTMVGSLVDSKCTIYFGVVFLLTLSSLSENSFNCLPKRSCVHGKVL